MPAQGDQSVPKIASAEDPGGLIRELERHRSLIAALPHGIQEIDTRGVITFANPAHHRLYGYDEGQLVGMSIYDLNPPGPARDELRQYLAYLAREQPPPVPWLGHNLTRDGRLIDIRVDWDYKRDSSGRLAGFVSVLTDVTAQHEAEQALAESERRFRSVFDNAAVGVALVGPDGRVTEANDADCRFLGYPREELVGMHFSSFTHPDDLDLDGALYGSLLAGARDSYAIDKRYVRKDGEVVWGRLEVSLAGGQAGASPFTMVVCEDITESRRAEEALRWESSVNRAVAALSKALISTGYDAAGVAKLVLHLARELTGCEKGYVGELDAHTGDLVGHSFSMMLPEECRVAHAADLVFPRGGDGRYPGLWGHALNTGEAFYTNDAAAHPSSRGLPAQHVPVRQFLSVPTRYRGKAVGQLSLANKPGGFRDRDLQAVAPLADLYALAVHRHRAEREAADLEARMREAQKLESLGVLAGGIAHDFNNLLTGVLGYADLALLQLPHGTPGRENLHHIEIAAQRAAELTNQMLAYSGRGRFVVEPADLNHLVEEMNHLLQAVISKKALLRFELAPSLPAVRAAASQIRQVFMNLITNASEALGDAVGSILVRTGRVAANRAYLADALLAEGLPEGEYVFLEVSDTGCGMDEGTRRRMFDPFFTTKFTGRGLGLAAVLGIVRGHRGAIRVQSEPGQGTTFRVLLPASEDVSGACREPQGDDQVSALTDTVLVADDESSIRDVAGSMLEAFGFRVLSAEDGRQAVEVYRERRDEISLVLLDMTMPQMGGEEAFRELRRICPDVRVVLTSGYSEQEVTHRLANEGLAGFIQKPYRAKELLAAIRKALGSSETG